MPITLVDARPLGMVRPFELVGREPNDPDQHCNFGSKGKLLHLR